MAASHRGGVRFWAGQNGLVRYQWPDGVYTPIWKTLLTACRPMMYALLTTGETMALPEDVALPYYNCYAQL